MIWVKIFSVYSRTLRRFRFITCNACMTTTLCDNKHQQMLTKPKSKNSNSKLGYVSIGLQRMKTKIRSLNPSLLFTDSQRRIWSSCETRKNVVSLSNKVDFASRGAQACGANLQQGNNTATNYNVALKLGYVAKRWIRTHLPLLQIALAVVYTVTVVGVTASCLQQHIGASFNINLFRGWAWQGKTLSDVGHLWRPPSLSDNRVIKKKIARDEKLDWKQKLYTIYDTIIST